MTKWQKFWKTIGKHLKGLICGSDGLLSYRRVFGIILGIYGAVELHNALPPPNDSIVSLVWTFRGGIAILGACVMVGAITMQNIREIRDMASKGKDNV